MKNLINFGNFIYDCMDIEINNSRFTYKTGKKEYKKIIHKKIKQLINICNNFNFYDEYDKDKNNHIVKGKKIEIIEEIFKNNYYNDEWINQNILNTDIYQIKLNKKVRLFYSKEIYKNLFIINLLFLDINHMVYNNEKYEKKYDFCLVCNNKKCI